MATTTGTLIVYDSYKREMQNKNVKIEATADTFICGLSTSTYVPDRSAHEALADITNEVSGNGYARETLASVSHTEPTLGTWRFNSADPVFNASGGSIVARWWWVFNDTATTPLDMLCFYGLLDDTPADVTTTDTNSLTLQVHASGWTELSGGET
jgi:hypothetical protein